MTVPPPVVPFPLPVPREVHADLPAEPADEAVVVDARGLAWQRRGNTLVGLVPVAGYPHRWFPSGVDQALPWPLLLANCGPLTVVHEPTGEQQ